MYQLGVDIEGTFTDAVLTDDEGNTWLGKAPSTADPRGGFLAALAWVVADTGRDSETVHGELTRIMYGTTIATNVAVQMTGATVGLVNTRSPSSAVTCPSPPPGRSSATPAKFVDAEVEMRQYYVPRLRHLFRDGVALLDDEDIRDIELA